MTDDEVTRKLGHVERELAQHGSALATTAQQMSHLAHRSDERRYIRERFDDLKEDGKPSMYCLTAGMRTCCQPVGR